MLSLGVPGNRVCLSALAILTIGAALFGFSNSPASAGDARAKAERPTHERPTKGEDPKAAKLQERCDRAENSVKVTGKKVKKAKKQKRKAKGKKAKKKAKRKVNRLKKDLAEIKEAAENYCSEVS